MKQILQSAADISIPSAYPVRPDGAGNVKNSMKNITKTMPELLRLADARSTMPEQFYKV